MKLHRKYRVEQACSKDVHGRPALADPYLRILGDERGWLEATDSYIAARVSVRGVTYDSDGWVPVDALKQARKACGAVDEADVPCENGRVNVYGTVYPRPRPGSTFAELESFYTEARLEDAMVEFGIDAKLLYKLAQALGSERVRLRIRSPLKPIYVQPLGDPDAEGLIMPIRLG